jgi:5'-nucleotidase (lipoprotein e(P4) family)
LISRSFVAALAALSLGAAVAQDTPDAQSLALLNSVLWTQQSVEHQAASLATYRAASAALRAAVKQPGWASLETGPARSGRRAVVVDIDETLVDNAAYSAWMVQSNQPYEEPSWQAWMALRQAVAIPGAVEFAKLAKRLKVDVFFVTNRECVPAGDDPCPALAHTRENLVQLGFAQAARPGTLLLRNQRPEWAASDKSSRRQWVAQTHRIVMLVGDDMGDFLPVDKVQALRAGQPDAQTTAAMAWLGKRWFVIPNPMYGSWEKVVPHAIPERIRSLQPPPGWGASAPVPAGAASGS